MNCKKITFSEAIQKLPCVELLLGTIFIKGIYNSNCSSICTFYIIKKANLFRLCKEIAVEVRWIF